MDIHSLEAFLMVAEHGSFSRAADKLFLTQPAVSKRIANLEQQLNAALFDRIGRDVYLTEAGELLKPKARQIVDEVKDLQTTIGQISTEEVRQLSMASSHHIGLHYLGPILKRFTEQNPLAQLDLRFMESEQAVASLLKRELELALTTVPKNLHRDLASQVIWRDELKFVVARDHPLSQKKGTLRLNELAHLTAILPDRQTTTFQIIEQTFSKHHIPLKRVISVNYLETIRTLVSHGLGWSLLPENLIDDELQTLQIDRVQLRRDLGIIRHRGRTISRGARALIEIVEQTQSRQSPENRITTPKDEIHAPPEPE
ncbi:MAG: LysR family transcriptional regulator [Reinekea sp.]|jgi:DNA-binding transcriptional LysR family regulator